MPTTHSHTVSLIDGMPMAIEFDYYPGTSDTRTEPGEAAEVAIHRVVIGDVQFYVEDIDDRFVEFLEERIADDWEYWCEDIGDVYPPIQDEKIDDPVELAPMQEKCPHGNDWGECDACDAYGDFAADAAREDRMFGRR